MSKAIFIRENTRDITAHLARLFGLKANWKKASALIVEGT